MSWSNIYAPRVLINGFRIEEEPERAALCGYWLCRMENRLSDGGLKVKRKISSEIIWYCGSGMFYSYMHSVSTNNQIRSVLVAILKPNDALFVVNTLDFA